MRTVVLPDPRVVLLSRDASLARIHDLLNHTPTGELAVRKAEAHRDMVRCFETGRIDGHQHYLKVQGFVGAIVARRAAEHGCLARAGGPVAVSPSPAG